MQNVDLNLYPYLQILLSRAQDDITEAIDENQLNERVVITRLESTGIEIEEKYRTLIIKSFEEIRMENKYFHLVGSIEALKKTIIVNAGLESYTSEEFSEMQRLSADLNSDYYAIINVSAVGKTLAISLIIRNALDHNIVWGKKWSTILRKGEKSFNIGLYQGITFAGQLYTANMFPVSLHLGIDLKIFTFVDFGFFLDPGINIKYPGNIDDKIIGINSTLGIKFAVDMINIFNVPYKNVELPIYFRAGLSANYYIDHLYSYIVGVPLITFATRPGLAVIINRNYTIFVEFDPLAGVGTLEKAVYTGFYYRFEF